MSDSPAAAVASPVLLETIENGVALLVMNRPDKLNALNNELANALNQTFEKLGRNDAVRVVVLTGAGRAFCAGGDLAAIGKGRAAKDRSGEWSGCWSRDECRAGRGYSHRRGRSDVRAEFF